jgi:hypothetical protein
MIVVSGIGAVADEACNSTPFLKPRTTRKFMGKQVARAGVAAARALQSASMDMQLGERCGLYMAVGYIPFEREDIDLLIDASLDDGRFSMQRFASNAFGVINPLLTFRVLPNMPAFHVSLNFNIQGPYVVSYPGVAQFYLALEEAFAALESKAIDVALVGAVADQDNLLVQHHFSRIDPPIESSRLANASAFLVLQREADAKLPRARLADWKLEYRAVDPFASMPHRECLQRNGVCVAGPRHLGPASLGVALAASEHARLVHKISSRDGFDASSVWEVA